MTISLQAPHDKRWLFPILLITVVMLSIYAAFLVSDLHNGRKTDTYQVTVDRQSETPSPAVPDETPSMAESVQTDGSFVASKNGKKYHIKDCGHAANIREKNLITFDTAEDAVAGGYEPCGVCLPDS